ncbi:MAG: hypothetical protein ACI8PZ_002473 [Myxococcota bacterium]|jgi:hypothetical protein
MSTAFNRRTLLRGVLGGATVSIGLPLLECFLNVNGDALAGGGVLPTRFGIFYWGNGILPEFWTPLDEGDAEQFALSPQLAPLAPVKSKICVVSGTSLKVPNVVPHMSGAAGILSAIPLIGNSDADNTFGGPSIDQVIAAEIGGLTRFRSLEFGVEPREGLSFNAPYSKNPPEDDPYSLFERVFGAGFREPGEDALIDPSVALRRSVLDAVMTDMDRMSKRVSAADRIRLEQHLDGIRELELRLARLEEDPPDLAACARPGPPLEEYPDQDGRPQLAAKNRAMADITAMVLACDQTRVFSNWFTYPVSNTLFPGISAGHHNLTHDEPGQQRECNLINTMIMEECSYFLQALDAIEEGDGTLLDHSAVLCTTDVSLGRTHSLDDFPIVIGGGACGQIRTGFHYRSETNENSTKVLLTLIRAMGIAADAYGEEDARATDSLGAIEI